MSPSRLRVAVTPPSGHKAIPAKASSDLGFDISMKVMATEALFSEVLTNSHSFDAVQVEAWMVDDLVKHDLLEPISSTEIIRFTQISKLFIDGVVGGKPVDSHGTPPWKTLFADNARSERAAYFNAVPTVCACDTLGWREDRVAAPVHSWSALVDPANAGRVALADVPAVSHIELSLALQACGSVQYKDIGNQTAEEIDATYHTIMALGPHFFFGFWATFETSVKAMLQGPVAVQSCWPPAVTALRAKGVPLRYAPLDEGGRGWAGGFAIMRGIGVERRARAIAYINWYLNGWAGAYLARQGYYPSTLEAVRDQMDAAEYSYWFEAGRAERPVQAPDGQIIGQAHDRREGGSFEDWMGRIACWNTRMSGDALIRSHWKALVSQTQTKNVQKLPIF